MNKEALATLFYREVEKIATNKALSKKEKIEALYRLLSAFFVELTRRERLQFSTLFARIAYACHLFTVDKKLQYYLHSFRKKARQDIKEKEEEEKVYALGIKVLCKVLEVFLNVPVPPEVQSLISEQWPIPIREHKVKSFRQKVRVVVLGEDKEAEQLIARDAEYSTDPIRVQYNEANRNDSFMPTIKVIQSIFGFPVTLNLIDVEVDEKGIYHPRAFVVEPDYLIDVTAIAECFRPDGENPWSFLLKKFLPFHPNKYIMVGNIANYFLDELMTDSDQTFKKVFSQAFQLSPLAFCLFDNREVREIMQRSQKHFLNLKLMAKKGFAEEGILADGAFLEPSFYSETYGIQGRLDVLYKKGDKSIIVELKSGNPFKPNIYGLSVNHFTQTLLYDLMVRSAFGSKSEPTNYILYSGLDEKPLRFAPRVKAQQYEALQLRNQLMALERLLANLGTPERGDLLVQGQHLFGRLKTSAFPNIRGFFMRDLELFEKSYANMSPIVRKYFIAYSGFIAREHQLAKMGSQEAGRNKGLASLWLTDIREKRDNFEVINHLRLAKNEAEKEEPLVFFERTADTHPLANFRVGDIAVLYPHQDAGIAPLSNQIFKCTIVSIDASQVSVRLRSRQFNSSIFEAYPLWNIEHDLLDSSFSAMYRSLFSFASCKEDKQEILLTQRAPRKGEIQEIPVPDELTKEQQSILIKAVSAEDYFLLWGPPGTGKTSMMLKYLVSYLLDNTQENILLLAYTNRAVDEICEALEHVRQDIRRHYLRIGSRYSTSPRFESQLLSTKIQQVHTRKDLKAIIDSHRIIVATVSSIAGKPELLKLKHFHRAIIDEASQILEPVLVGLLPHFDRFILIGDHKQLPAVVVQNSEQSGVEDRDLQDIGLVNLRNSLFERLYKACIINGWYWAYSQLSHQGRMHQDIMDFPNRYFYEGSLKILPDHITAYSRQVADTFLTKSDVPGMTQRLSFIDTPTDPNSLTQKTNVFEAKKIVDIVRQLQRIYDQHGRQLHVGSIGIITPYRAQIAQIKSELEQNDLLTDLLTIDTVERYQGGARDVIIISLCTNTLSQLGSLSSLSEEGVDRKLNVALTRAREMVVVLGNTGILNQSEIYRSLINYCEEHTLEP
jgi:DNA replication ATP-dependent helicase Dna2